MSINNPFYYKIASKLANNNLECNYICFENMGINTLGKVISKDKKTIQVQTILPPWENKNSEIVLVSPFHINPNSTNVKYVDNNFEQNYCAQKVYLHAPDSIDGKTWNGIEFTLKSTDKELETIIRKLDFKNIEDATRKTYKHFTIPEKKFIESKSLGDQIKDGEAFCRHRAALLYFFATNSDYNAQVEISPFDSDGNSHSFLSYKSEKDETIFADPTLNLFGTKDEILKHLVDSKKDTFYHSSTKPMPIVLEYKK